MWFLTHSTSNKIVFIQNKKTSLGRKGCNIELLDDNSLSRLHAHFMLVDDKLLVQDAKSKYGTYLNGKTDDSDRLKPDNNVELKDGDRILFGKFSNEWNVCHVRHKTAISMLDQEDKQQLETILRNLKVKVSDVVDESCTHLTMPQQPNVSHKLLQALVMCVPIVTKNYWLRFQECMLKHETLPKCLDYVPYLKEEIFIAPGTVSLAINAERKKLFANKTFIFTSNTQMNVFQGIIESAGGKAISMTKSKVTMSQCSAKNAIVIQPKDTQSQTQNEAAKSQINALFATKKLRMIPDTEIGIAVLHVSIEKYCNPQHLDASYFKADPLQTAKSIVIALGTESLEFKVPTRVQRKVQSKKIVPQATEFIDLDSDEEIMAENKENLSTQSSLSDKSIPPTQDSPSVRDIIQEPAPVVENVHEDSLNIPQTQDSVSSSDSSIYQSAESNVNNAAKMSTSKSSASSSKSSSVSNNASSLFNFSDNSLSYNNKSLRKRKNSDDDGAGPSGLTLQKRTKQTDPAPKAINRRTSNIDDATDEAMPLPSRPTRKRTAETAMGTGGGLFSFNTSFVKKLKSVDNTAEQSQPRGVSGIVPLSKPRDTTPITPTKTCNDDDYDSCDSGIWLSKAMTSFNLNESNSEVKMEMPEQNSMIETEDFQPQMHETIFEVLDVTSNVTSSMVSKRKHFVKKQNFKRQSLIVTTTVVKVEDTHISPDDF